MKISIDAGHNCSPDKGASGFRVEDEMTKATVAQLVAKFTALGHQVLDCTPYVATFNSVSGSLGYRVNKANAFGSDLHLCIHYNAGGGTGVECWIAATGGKAQEYAHKICSEISKLGYQNRGVKVGNLYVPKYTNMPCVLVEGCFVDTAEDCNKWNAEASANAIIQAVLGQAAPVAQVPEVKPQPVVNITPVKDSGIIVNAVIVNDWLYVRDSAGNVIPGRIDINDKVQILDVSGSTQLNLVKYPTAIGTRTEHIYNATNCIKYLYQGQWKNGSKPEIVYQDSACTKVIGTIDSYETATPLYRQNGVLQVVYNTSKGINTKSGYVKYNGGFTVF